MYGSVFIGAMIRQCNDAGKTFSRRGAGKRFSRRRQLPDVCHSKTFTPSPPTTYNTMQQYRYVISAFVCLFVCLTLTVLPSLAQQQEIPQPPSVRARDGVLTDTLNLVLATIAVGERQVLARTYNGTAPGSIWRVHPGETMRIHLNNQLPPNPDADLPDQGNYPQRANTTNLHVHGLNVSPKDNGDNVLLSIEPQSSFDFEFELPADHAAGTYWYHPHHHTSTWSQVVNGLAGAIVIEDPTDPSVTDPALLAMSDRVFLFSSYMIDTATNTIGYPRRLASATATTPIPGSDSPVFVNGVLSGTVTMRPGEIQRWRFIDATYEFSMRLTWLHISNGDTTRVEQWEIANDGLYFPAPKPTSQVTFTAGARSDVLVQAPAAEGRYIVQLEALDRGMRVMETRELIDIIVGGDPVLPAMTMPAVLPKAMAAGTIRDEEITGTRQITFRIGDFGEVAKDSSAITRTFTIDNSPFSHDVVNMTVKAGDVEEWTIVNESGGYHPFHIHVNEFEVVEVNGVRQDPVIWRDVLLLAPNSTYKIRQRYTDYDGKTVLHCHFLPHEDWGMMNIIDILPRTSNVKETPWTEPLAFPNPVTGRMSTLNVQLPEFLGDRRVDITLHDITGSVVRTLQTSAAESPVVEIDVQDMPAGSYYVRVSDGEAYRTSDMVIIVR